MIGVCLRVLAVVGSAVVAGVLAAGAVLKWLTPGPAADALDALGVFETASAPLVLVLSGVEFAAGSALALWPRSRVPSAVCVLLLTIFTAGLVLLAFRAPDQSCGCFGRLTPGASPREAIARNLVMIGALVLTSGLTASQEKRTLTAK